MRPERVVCGTPYTGAGSLTRSNVRRIAIPVVTNCHAARNTVEDSPVRRNSISGGPTPRDRAGVEECRERLPEAGAGSPT